MPSPTQLRATPYTGADAQRVILAMRSPELNSCPFLSRVKAERMMMLRGGTVRMRLISDAYVQSCHTTSCIPPRSGVRSRTAVASIRESLGEAPATMTTLFASG